MRRLVVSTFMSLDGYVAGPGGNVMALPFDGWFDAHNLERLREADTLVLGATTYRQMKSYWPTVAQDPTMSPAVAADPDVAELHRETGRRNDEIRKVVISDSLNPDDTAPWNSTTTIVPRADAERAVTDLKDQSGADLLVFGSRTVWNRLLAAGLVDELHVMLGSAALGEGVPAFGEGPYPALQVEDVQRRDGSGNVLLRYSTGSSSDRGRRHGVGR